MGAPQATPPHPTDTLGSSTHGWGSGCWGREGGASQLSNHLLLLGVGASLPRIFLLYRSTSSLKRASAPPAPPGFRCAWGAEQGGGDGGPRHPLTPHSKSQRPGPPLEEQGGPHSPPVRVL